MTSDPLSELDNIYSMQRLLFISSTFLFYTQKYIAGQEAVNDLLCNPHYTFIVFYGYFCLDIDVLKYFIFSYISGPYPYTGSYVCTADDICSQSVL